MVGTSKRQSSEGKISCPLEVANSSSSDNESQSETVGCKESDKANEGNDMENNRMEADAAITSSAVKETVLEPDNIGANSRKPLSHESCLKIVADKGKQSSQVETSLASSAAKNQAPQPHGPLSKSISFNNSKVPKVKQLNEVPQKAKILKESRSSVIKKEAPVSMTTSATFKKPKPCEPTNKANSSALSTAEGPRVANPLLSQKVTTDRCTSILGCPSSTTATMVPLILSRAETTVQHLPSGINMADTAYGQGGKNFPGNNELKKPLYPVGSTGILGPGAQRKIIQSSDILHRDNKLKDPPGFQTRCF